MELRVVIIFFVTVPAVVFGQQKCRDQLKCMPFRDCLEFQPYVDKPNKLWPQYVKDKVKDSFCGIDPKSSEKIYKFCCTPNLLNLKQCGKSSKERIAHGKIAEIFEFPWMALLGNKQKKFHCGGSLIAESFVLTAAHCSRFTEIVRLGETDLSQEIDCIYAQGEEDCADPYQDIEVAKFIRHKLYSSSKKENDIGLVKLAQPAELNYNVQPICLPLPQKLLKEIPLKMTVSGWGHTEFQNGTSKELRYANLPIVEPEECQMQLQGPFNVGESHVCAGGAGDLQDNCRGDSGGPLQYFGRNGMVIHGVVSWGLKSCGTDKAPGVYTKVSHYLDWIIDNLK